MMGHYDSHGPPDAPAVVLLHSASDTRKVWLPQMRPLAESFRVLAPDLPGHGTLADVRFTFRGAVQHVHDVLAGEGISRALLVGVSLGGCVAIHCAADCPGQIAGLVLSGCTFDATSALARLVLTGEALVFPRGRAYFTRAFHRAVRRRFPADMAEEMIAAGTYWRSAADAVRAMRGVDFRARLAQYPGPTLILNGRRDWVHRTAERSFARAARRAVVRVVPNAGHLVGLDAPDVFTDAIRAFGHEIFAAAPRIGAAAAI